MWSGLSLDKLLVNQMVNKFPIFYGTWRLITVFRRTRHLALSLAVQIHFSPSLKLI
jgi:hypothetical protein